MLLSIRFTKSLKAICSCLCTRTLAVNLTVKHTQKYDSEEGKNTNVPANKPARNHQLSPLPLSCCFHTHVPHLVQQPQQQDGFTSFSAHAEGKPFPSKNNTDSDDGTEAAPTEQARQRHGPCSEHRGAGWARGVCSSASQAQHRAGSWLSAWVPLSLCGRERAVAAARLCVQQRRRLALHRPAPHRPAPHRPARPRAARPRTALPPGLCTTRTVPHARRTRCSFLQIPQFNLMITLRKSGCILLI